MGVATHKDVAIKLSLDSSKCFKITPWNNLMTVDHSNLEVANLDDFGLWQVGIIIEFTFCDVSLALCRCKILEPLDGL